MRQIIGIDDTIVQCPLCKGISNTLQPCLPPGKGQPLASYIAFVSDLVNCLATGERRDLLEIDIRREPLDFARRIFKVILQQLLCLTTVKQFNMLQQSEQMKQSSDLTLRDLVFLLFTVKECFY